MGSQCPCNGRAPKDLEIAVGGGYCNAGGVISACPGLFGRESHSVSREICILDQGSGNRRTGVVIESVDQSLGDGLRDAGRSTRAEAGPCVKARAVVIDRFSCVVYGNADGAIVTSILVLAGELTGKTGNTSGISGGMGQ